MDVEGRARGGEEGGDMKTFLMESAQNIPSHHL